MGVEEPATRAGAPGRSVGGGVRTSGSRPWSESAQIAQAFSDDARGCGTRRPPRRRRRRRDRAGQDGRARPSGSVVTHRVIGRPEGGRRRGVGRRRTGGTGFGTAAGRDGTTSGQFPGRVESVPLAGSRTGSGTTSTTVTGREVGGSRGHLPVTRQESFFPRSAEPDHVPTGPYPPTSPRVAAIGRRLRARRRWRAGCRPIHLARGLRA